jgi:hypothetical protein
MISLLLPTRKRPEKLGLMVSSIKETAFIQPEIVVYVDNDDKASIHKANELGVNTIVGPKLVFTDYWNKCYEKATGDILMMAADDLIFRTHNWDVMVEEEFKKSEDKIILVYGRDLHPRVSIPSHPIIHRKWVDAVGYFSPPYFQSGGCDIWLNDVAAFLERKHFVDFTAEHMHYTVRKSDLDETYKAQIARRKEYNVTDLYYAMITERMEDAAKLMNVIEKSAPVH